MTRVLWLAGVSWDAVPGTDRRLVEALADAAEVVWVDPPRQDAWGRSPQPEPVPGFPHVRRLRIPAPRGAWRPGIRRVTDALGAAWVRRACSGEAFDAVIVASPLTSFPGGISAPRILYVTDDWAAGAALMSLDRGFISRRLDANLRDADAVAAVSPRLLSRVLARTPEAPRGVVLPNGAPLAQFRAGARRRVAGVVGQFNARLDLECLEAVVDAGVALRLVGPLVRRDTRFVERFMALVARDGVEWSGAVPASELPAVLSELSVGLTPYVVDEFNQASFPLKTLEYLAAGLPVVSTDIEASRWLSTPFVAVAGDAREFAAATVATVDSGGFGVGAGKLESARRGFAAQHSWDARARTLMEAIAMSSEASRPVLSEGPRA